MTTDLLHIDFETCSAANLAEIGVHKYAEHWTTHVLMMAYRWGSKGAISIWYYWEDFPASVREHVESGGMVCAHNAAFERTLWNVCLRRYNLIRDIPALHLPELKIGQMICTMARASALNLPGSLDYIAEVMGVDQRKDSEGGKLMLRYCRPASVSVAA